MNKALPHTIEEMETLFNNANRRSTLFCVLTILLAGICGYIYFTLSPSSLKTSMLVIFWIIIGLWLGLSALIIAIYPLTSKKLSLLPDEQIGNFSKAEVLEIVNEMWQNSGKKELPTIYISELSMVNAFAINTLLNFYNPVNAIYITRMTFSCLTRQELIGILYHEMAHFNKYIYFETRTMNITIYFFMLFPLSLTVLVPTLVLKGLFVIGMLSFMGYLWNKVRAVHDLEGHALEYLCDLEASKQVGRLAMINALIVICRENIPKEEEARKKIQKKLISKKPLIPVDWTAFDTHMVNGKIEPEEYDKLIHTLVTAETPQLLEGSENDGDSMSHPSLTNRVLFLHRNASQ
ncbi:MAG: hypothetical protein EB023_02770 [Flavobacteriia bacterium]|nr:hypothetical protein [Flavobacteriia bacterium]